MRRYIKKIAGWLICICVCMNSIAIEAKADAQETYESGFVAVGFADNTISSYPVKKAGDAFYMSAEDLAAITGYVYTKGDFLSFERPYEKEYLTAVSVEFDGKTEAMGNEYKLDVIESDDTYFLPLDKMLYLLHALWSVEEKDGEKILNVNPMGKTILDFVGEYQLSILEDRTSQGELLLNGESSMGRAWRSTLANVVRNFDARFYVPIVGTQWISQEKYEEVLMELSEEDEKFVDDFGQKAVNEALEGGIFEDLSTDVSSLSFFTDIIADADEGTEAILTSAVQKSKVADKISKGSKLSDLKSADIKTISKGLSYLSTAADIVLAAKNVVEMANWVQDADERVQKQLTVLSDFDNTPYRTSITNPLKKAAKSLLNRKTDPAPEVGDDILMKAMDIGGQALVGLTFTGMAADAIQVMDSVQGMTDDGYDRAMDTATASFRADYLIKTESVALNEELIAYHDVMGKDFSQEKIERLRNALMLTLRLNMRAKANVYYLNTLGNDTENWESSSEASRIKKLIADDYAKIDALMSTEDEDQNLQRGDFKDMFQDEVGATREKLSADIFRTEKYSYTPEEEMESKPSSSQNSKSISEMTLDEICERVEKHYDDFYQTDKYAVFNATGEVMETDYGYYLILRYQGGKEANVLATGVEVNSDTGVVTDEWGNEWQIANEELDYSEAIGKTYEYDDGGCLYSMKFSKEDGQIKASMATWSSGGVGTSLQCFELIVKNGEYTFDNVKTIVGGYMIVAKKNVVAISPGKNNIFVTWKDDDGKEVIKASLKYVERGGADENSTDVYKDTLNMYYDKITNGWDQTEDVSYLFYWNYTDVKSLSDAGYALVDLDGNGVSELIVTSKEAAKEGMIYDLYTYQNNQVIHLKSSGERERYYLSDEGTIYMESSSSAYISEYSRYYLDASEGALKVKEAVVYDGWDDEENPWFYVDESQRDKYVDQNTGYNLDAMTHITEEEAKEKMDSYQKKEISLVSFEDYSR